jgi:hypothetical protein
MVHPVDDQFRQPGSPSLLITAACHTELIPNARVRAVWPAAALAPPMLAAASASLASGVTASGASSAASAEAGLSSAFDQSVDCTFNASMVEDVVATELISSRHCEMESCRTSLAVSMARNYEEVLGWPFNVTIADFAIRCWCDGSMGVMAHGAVVIDTYEEMHATCRDPECRMVKAHTLERYMDGICTQGEALGGHCPDGREVEMASLVSDCSCDYHALGWPFPWAVLEPVEARVEDETLTRLCGLDSCDKVLARLNDIWPDSVAPGVRNCGVNSAWEVVGPVIFVMLLLTGLAASALICCKAHREARLRGPVELAGLPGAGQSDRPGPHA